MNFYENAADASEGLILRAAQDRQWLLRTETEDFLRAECLAIDERRPDFWHWNYSSEEAFLASVADNRQRWQEAVGDFGEPEADMAPATEPFFETDAIRADWIHINLYGSLRGRAVLALPKGQTGPLPVVIAQHGIGSSPELVFGMADEGELYHAYGRHLVEAGFAVLAPLNVTEAAPRARLHRMCLLLGKTLPGLEIRKIRRFIDYLATRPEVDTNRLGMWGISLGGYYTLFATPLEPRIKVAIICAFFNRRPLKMVVDDPRYSCFLSTSEEHIFVPGWLREFSDSDLASLICPRPLMVQTGKADAIAWWPFVVEEFERAREHYRALGVEERCQLDLHEAGHEIRVKTGIEFLSRWLSSDGGP